MVDRFKARLPIAQTKSDALYLTFAVDQLRHGTEPLVVFRQSLSDQDLHLVEAVNKSARPIAVSLRSQKRNDVRKRQLEIAARLAEVEDLHCFDAATHPLGNSALHVPTVKLRRLAKQMPWFGRRSR